MKGVGDRISPELTQLAVGQSCFPGLAVYERAQFSCRPGGVSGMGKLHIGCQWAEHFSRESQMVISKKGSCTVDGEFWLFDGCFVSVHGVLRLGSGYINSGANICVFKSLTIGHNVAIADNVTIRDSDNHLLPDRSSMEGDIVIGDDVWIGLNATILKGVRIGRRAVVAAGAVVNRDVPADTLVAGVPAKAVRRIAYK
jgi:carbonic anhydrase/acetyltransferase-like protein (isoleucine patch superfamily)